MSRLFSFRWPWPQGSGILLILAVGFASADWFIGRKVAAMLVLPVGLLWIAGWMMLFAPRLKFKVRLGLLAGWLLYSSAGSPYVGIALLRRLEKPFYGWEEIPEPLDALALLGGGTILSPGGLPALGTHGDRVLRPAIHYHAGDAIRLISAGRSVTEIGDDRLLARETSEIWQSLGVPREAILELNEPRNTSEELAALAALLASHPEWKRVGLCSSASHLRRAFHEAEKQGLDLIPVPSDFRSTPLPLSPLYLVPQGRGFRDVQTALWEYLGALF